MIIINQLNEWAGVVDRKVRHDWWVLLRVVLNVRPSLFLSCVVVWRREQIRVAAARDACLKQGSASDNTTVGDRDVELKADADNKTKTAAAAAAAASLDNDAKCSRDAENSRNQLASESESTWEDVYDSSETSEVSGSCCDISPQPTTTTVTVVGSGLIQVSTADPLIHSCSLGSDEMGAEWKNGDSLYKQQQQRCLWDSCDEQEWHRSVEEFDDDDAHHLVQLQNILPLFVFGVNNDGSRSVRLAVIGDHQLHSEYLLSAQWNSGRLSSYTAEETSNAPRNNSFPPKSVSRWASELIYVADNNGNTNMPAISCLVYLFLRMLWYIRLLIIIDKPQLRW